MFEPEINQVVEAEDDNNSALPAIVLRKREVYNYPLELQITKYMPLSFKCVQLITAFVPALQYHVHYLHMHPHFCKEENVARLRPVKELSRYRMSFKKVFTSMFPPNYPCNVPFRNRRWPGKVLSYQWDTDCLRIRVLLPSFVPGKTIWVTSEDLLPDFPCGAISSSMYSDAAQSGDEVTVQDGLTEGLPVDWRHPVTGETALQRACQKGHLSIVNLLLEWHAQVNLADLGGRTPLIEAARHGHLEIVKLLLAKNSSVNQQGKEQHTAVSMAASAGQLECLRYLVEHKGSVDQQDNHGRTALIKAFLNGHSQCVDFLLLTAHAKTQLQDKDLKTLWDHAANPPLEARVWKPNILLRRRSQFQPQDPFHTPGQCAKLVYQVGNQVYVTFPPSDLIFVFPYSEMELVKAEEDKKAFSTTISCGDCKVPLLDSRSFYRCCECGDLFCGECIEVVSRNREKDVFLVRESVQMCTTCLEKSDSVSLY